MSWKDSIAHATPQNLQVQRDAENEYVFQLRWDSFKWILIKNFDYGYIDHWLSMLSTGSMPPNSPIRPWQ